MASQVVAGLVGAALGVAMTTAIALAVRNTPDACHCPIAVAPQPQLQPPPQPQPLPLLQLQPPPQPVQPIDPGAPAEADIDAGTDLVVTCHLDEVACVLADQPPACCSVYRSPQARSTRTTLTAAQVRIAVQRLRDEIADCGSGAHGTVTVRVHVEDDGSVSRVDVIQTPDDQTGACVARVMRQARFPRSDDGVSFTYPFVF